MTHHTPAHELTDATYLAQEIIEAICTPLVALGREMRVHSAKGAFYRVFQMSPGDVDQQCLYDLDGGLRDIPRMRELLEAVWNLDRPFDDLERSVATTGTLGLTLAESKRVLHVLQQTVVEHQVGAYLEQQRPCPHCRKRRKLKDSEDVPHTLRRDPGAQPPMVSLRLPG